MQVTLCVQLFRLSFLFLLEFQFCSTIYLHYKAPYFPDLNVLFGFILNSGTVEGAKTATEGAGFEPGDLKTYRVIRS